MNPQDVNLTTHLAEEKIKMKFEGLNYLLINCVIWFKDEGETVLLAPLHMSKLAVVFNFVSLVSWWVGVERNTGCLNKTWANSKETVHNLLR